MFSQQPGEIARAVLSAITCRYKMARESQEAIMANQAPLKYVFYIAAPPDKVWEGFVSPESNRIIFS